MPAALANLLLPPFSIWSPSMNLLSPREIILRAVTICPLLYVGQLWQSVLAYEPQTSAKRREGKAAFEKWAKSKRRQVTDLLNELVRKEELGTFRKDSGYVHEPIVTPEPLLRIEPGKAIEKIQETGARLLQALDDACGPDKSLVGYYRPLQFDRAELRNPFYLRAVSCAEQRKTDRREGATIEAFRIGSVYVSQLAFNRIEAATFELLHRPAVDALATEPHAQVVRENGVTVLYAIDTRLVDELEELSRRQQRSGCWLELWL
jgi:hypothetical protein